MTKGHGESFFEKNANWMLLRGFGTSTLASASVMMPFIGYIILYNSQLAPWLGGLGGLFATQNLEEVCPAHFSFFERLNLIYCGSFLLGISALIFKIASPRELRSYSGVNDFIDSEHRTMTARRVRSMYRTVNSRRPMIGASFKSRAPWLDVSVSIDRASSEFTAAKNDDVIFDLMRNFFQAQDRHHHRSAVFACLFFLIMGSSLLTLPAGDFTLRVFCAIASGGA